MLELTEVKKDVDAEKIVRALRICASENGRCEDCPYDGNGNGIFCTDNIMVVAADLIDRLTAENAQLRAERDAMSEVLRGTCRVCKHAKPWNKARTNPSWLRTCEHLNGAIAATGMRGCRYWEFGQNEEGGESHA